MSADFAITFHNNYIQVQHPEDYTITPENQRKLWLALAAACKKYQCRRVIALAPAPPKRSMNTMDAFDSAMQAIQAARGMSLACCFTGYQPDETSEFFKTVAHNRGVKVEFFTDQEQAFKWLGIVQREGVTE